MPIVHDLVTPSDYQILFLEYEQIARIFPGWSLTEIKQMPRRERKFWVKAARARASKKD